MNLSRKIAIHTVFFVGAGIASASTITNVNQATPNGWVIQNDNGKNGTGEFVAAGPGTPPNGSGSVEFDLTGTPDGWDIGTAQFSGTLISTITDLSETTYTTGAPEAPSIQFDITYAGAPAGYDGRLVDDNLYTGTIANGVWQTEDPMTGAVWFFTHTPQSATCSQANPCTLAQVVADFPSLEILGGTYLKAGSGWSAGSYNVNSFIISTSGGVNDEFVFGGSPVPEPATFALMGAALAAFAVALKRKQA